MDDDLGLSQDGTSRRRPVEPRFSLTCRRDMLDEGKRGLLVVRTNVECGLPELGGLEAYRVPTRFPR